MSAFGYSTKGQRFPVEILTSAEVRSLMAACSRRGALGHRDRALIATMYRAGLRVGELLALDVKDVDLASGEIRILRGKGGKARLVAVDGETAALVELWLAKRERAGVAAGGPLFCTFKGGPLSRVQVSQKVKALAKECGIEKRCNLHAIRHSRAVDLDKHGVSVTVIQEALGHSSLSTTETYLRHLSPKAVVEAMKGGEW